MSAGQALVEVALAALGEVEGLSGRHEARPLQAAFPYATVEAGAESDWSHKSGIGREVRLTIVIRDEGERPARLRRLLAESEAALGGLGGTAGAWRLVSFVFLRSRVVPEGQRRWAGAIDYRARMLGE